MLSNDLQRLYGEPAHQLAVLEIGAGTGRMTERLAPFAGSLTCTDKYPAMLQVLRAKLPGAGTITANTRELSDQLAPARQFDYVGAFWTLSYPIGECLETLENDHIIPRSDLESATEEAELMIAGLVRYIKPGGRLTAYFFDSESREQQAVTTIWEQLAPDPGGYRGFTREVAARGLQRGAADLGMEFTEAHYEGIAPFKDTAELRRWYELAHCKSIPALTGSPVFEEQLHRLEDTYTLSGGRVELPVGMYALGIESYVTESCGI